MPKNNDKLKELLEQAEQGTKAVFESENYRNYQSWRKAPAFRHGDISHTLLPRKEILRGLH